MRTLPVINAFSHAFRSTINNIAFAFHASWPWMAVLLPVLVAGNLYLLARGPVNPGEFPVALGAFGVLLGLIQGLAFASIAVNWHRYVLLDEMPVGAQRLRLDWPVWRYFGNIILISLIVGVIMLPVGFVAAFVLGATAAGGGFAGPDDFAGMLKVGLPLLAIVATLSLAFFYRYGVKLPAIALERRDFGLGDAWRATRGNFLPMLGMGFLYVLIGLAIFLASWLLTLVTEKLGGNAGAAISIGAQLVMQWLSTVFGITLLTSLYGFFVENRDF
jgi:hypothetical protein